MGSLSIWHWLLFLAVVLLLFGGKGKISEIMGDVAKGIKGFKKGLADEEDAAKKPGETAPGAAKTIEAHAATGAASSAGTKPAEQGVGTPTKAS